MILINERDRQIIQSVEKFRCLSRDHIARLHFSGNKNPVVRANAVLKRLTDRGYLKADRVRSPYVYYLTVNSQKTDHYLGIADVYFDLLKHGELKRFDVEPKLGGKGTVEPDIFAIWKGAAWFIEVQRSIYTGKTMNAKMSRYEAYRASGQWRSLDWQPTKPIFPHVWIIGDKKYNVRAYQSKTVDEFLKRMKRAN